MKFFWRMALRFGSALALVLISRWGLGIASPSQDKHTMMRVVGWFERLSTRVDALESRVHVWLIDRFMIDRLRWESMRRRFTSGGYSGDTSGA